MRIGVDATPWFNERGYGRYTRELLRALARVATDHEFVYFVDARDVGKLEVPPGNVTIRGVELSARPTEAATVDGNRSPGDMLRMTRAVKREPGLSVFFYPTVYTFFPAPRGTKALVCIHDAIIERNPKACLPSVKARLFWKLKVALALWQSRGVLTVSDFAKRDIHEYLGVALDRIFVTGEAASDDYQPVSDENELAAALDRAELPRGEPYFVYVGGFNPHKNLVMLIRVHGRLARELESPPRLVMVGTLSRDVFHTGTEEIREAIRAAGTEELTSWTGFAPDDELRFIHAGALALCLPSRCEGFGLPAVEAAACGTPVVATTESPLPRVLEGGGLFVAPDDEEGWFGALKRMCEDASFRDEAGRVALGRARALSWDAAGESALHALKEAAR